jgi:hypothetical protein
MIPSAHHTIEQLKYTFIVEMNWGNGATQGWQEVDGKTVYNWDNSNLWLSTIPNAINNDSEYMCYEEVVMLL